MLVRRRGPRRIPGPLRPHPCGKDIMTFSLADFMGYCMSVISAIEDLNLCVKNREYCIVPPVFYCHDRFSCLLLFAQSRRYRLISV